MRKVWVLLANSTYTKIFSCDDGKNLVEHKTFVHEEGHMKGRDLKSDGHGRVTQSNFYGSDSYETKVPVKTKEAEDFARDVCKYLDESLQSKKFEHLYLIVKAPFLSHIRHCLSPQVQKTIQAEIHKDLIHATTQEIREYLPSIL